MKHYLFECVDDNHEDCGEDFFVDAENEEEARKIINESLNNAEVEFCRELTDREYEIWKGYEVKC